MLLLNLKLNIVPTLYVHAAIKLRWNGFTNCKINEWDLCIHTYCPVVNEQLNTLITDHKAKNQNAPKYLQ